MCRVQGMLVVSQLLKHFFRIFGKIFEFSYILSFGKFHYVIRFSDAIVYL